MPPTQARAPSAQGRKDTIENILFMESPDDRGVADWSLLESFTVLVGGLDNTDLHGLILKHYGRTNTSVVRIHWLQVDLR